MLQLETHEADFITAYKTQMKKVKKELEYLRQKRDEANGALMNDSQIKNLQGWIAWFKNEAIQLDRILNAQKREISKQKHDEWDRKNTTEFLTKSLKESMKQNKSLKTATERQLKQNLALKAFLKENHPERQKKKDFSMQIKSTSNTGQNADETITHSKEFQASMNFSSARVPETSHDSQKVINVDEGNKAMIEMDVQSTQLNNQVDI